MNWNKWFKSKKQKENDRSIGAQIAKGFADGYKLENLGVKQLKKEMQEREELKRLIQDTIREEIGEKKKEQKYVEPTEALLRQSIKTLNDYCRSNNSCEYCFFGDGGAAKRCELNDKIECGNLYF